MKPRLVIIECPGFIFGSYFCSVVKVYAGFCNINACTNLPVKTIKNELKFIRCFSGAISKRRIVYMSVVFNFLYTLICDSMKDQVENTNEGLFRCTTTFSPQIRFVFVII